MATPNVTTRYARQEGVPAREAPHIAMSDVNAFLTATKDIARDSGYNVVGESGWTRLKDGRVRVYLDIQADAGDA